MRSAAPPLQGALIGCGFVSRYHLEAWSKIPEARLVALCDVNSDRLQEAGAKVENARGSWSSPTVRTT